MSDEMIELWTLQDVGAMKRLEQDGVLRCDGRKILHWRFREAYHWLIGQMEQRVERYPKGRFPLWAWLVKPDMRTFKHRFYGSESQVRIGFRIPRSRVLLHDYVSWHCVLNRFPLSLCEAEYNRFERNWNEQTIRRTWERIFDFDLLALSDPDWSGPVDDLDVQATFAELYAHEVFSMKVYQPRGPSR